MYCSVKEFKVKEEKRLLWQSQKSSTRKKSSLDFLGLDEKRNEVCSSLGLEDNVLTPKQHKELIDGLEVKINECLEIPMEVLEERLVGLCCVYVNELNNERPRDEVIEIFHMVNIIQEGTKNREKLSRVLFELQEICQIYLKSYEFLCDFIKLVNDLCLAYGMINFYSYRFRFDPRIEKIRALNLRNLYSDMINMEVIWLSLICQKPPLQYVLSSETQLLGKQLQNEFHRTLEVFMQASIQTEDFEKRSGWSLSKSIIENYGFHRRSTVKGILGYQGLTKKLFCCFKSNNKLRALELQDQLLHFELVYHTFESAILKSWFAIESIIKKN